MDYTPDIHFIESQRNTRLGWPKALGELIDNSFDANALQVVITFGVKSFSIADDGAGTADIASMVTLGSHKKHKTTALGMYGVGVKDAWLWAGDTIDLRTTFKGTTRSLRVTYPSDLRQEDGGRWIGPDPVERPSLPTERGTRILIANLKQRKPSSENINALRKMFMPALESGRQIVVIMGGQTIPLKPYQLPKLIETVTDKFEVGGRDVEIEIGIVANDQVVEHTGFLICYGHRVIDTSVIGTGGFSSNRLTGKIILGRGWKLTRNKDDLSDNSEELGDAIFERIKGLCESSQRMSHDIESAELASELAGMLNEGIKNARSKEKRDPARESSGSVLPKDTNRKRKNAQKIDVELPGSVEGGNGSGGQKRRGISVDWCQLPEDEIGKFDALTPAILLNENNPFIAHIRQPRNFEALYAVAMALLVHSQCAREGKQILAFERADFISGWGRVMNSLNFQEKLEVSNV
jgi:hypothetical protein